MTDDNQKKDLPNWKLVQRKAYYATQDGRTIRKTKNVTITAGWDKTSKDKGMTYVSFADVLQNITCDIDGRIDLTLFPAIKNDETNQEG